MNPAVRIYSQSLAYACACAPAYMSAASVQEAADKNCPTGIPGPAGKWLWKSGTAFADGTPSPCPCNTDPSRRHWQLECAVMVDVMSGKVPAQ